MRAPVKATPWWGQNNQATMGISRAILALRDGQLLRSSTIPSLAQRGNWPCSFHLGQGPLKLTISDMSSHTVSLAVRALTLIKKSPLLEIDEELDILANRMRTSALEALWQFGGKGDGAFYFRMPRVFSYYKTDELRKKTIEKLEFPPDLISTSLATSALSGTITRGIKLHTEESDEIRAKKLEDRAAFAERLERALFLIEGGQDIAYPLWLSGRKLKLNKEATPLTGNALALMTLAATNLDKTEGFENCLAFVGQAIDQIVKGAGSFDYSDSFSSPVFFLYAAVCAKTEGRIEDLQPYMGKIIDFLQMSQNWKGRYWDFGQPVLDTALALSTMISAGYCGETIESGISWLLSSQSENGLFESGDFYRPRGSTRHGWHSDYLTTCLALEALARYVHHF
jgi:hypothetical protein